MMSTVGMSKSCTDLPSVTSTDDRWDVEIENLSKTCHWNYLFFKPDLKLRLLKWKMQMKN